jgi:hypothetical protein
MIPEAAGRAIVLAETARLWIERLSHYCLNFPASMILHFSPKTGNSTTLLAL